MNSFLFLESSDMSARCFAFPGVFLPLHKRQGVVYRLQDTFVRACERVYFLLGFKYTEKVGGACDGLLVVYVFLSRRRGSFRFFRFVILFGCWLLELVTALCSDVQRFNHLMLSFCQ